MDKILLALDGTERSFEVVKYVAGIPRAKETGTVLFAVYDEVPDVYWDLGDQANLASRIAQTKAMSLTLRNSLEDQLAQAKEYLLSHGFDSARVKPVLHKREKGISRDIISEARTGYSAVLAGRRGVARIQEILLGSISTRLLQGLTDIPLCFVGKGVPEFKNVLVAVDGSENSLKAVDFVGWLMKGCQGEVSLLHVIRSKDKTVVEEAEARIKAFYEKAKERLINKGIASTSLSTQVIYGVDSRSMAIIQVARKEDFGTIVVGRRGLSAVREFFIGRVSNRVVQLAKGLSVWIVS